MRRPLDGYLVVALEQAVAVPFATRQLADLGARVIKVERPGTGDFARGYDERVHGESSYFVWLNRSKESIALDLKSDDGLAVMRALVGRADVFVQNLAPGATERLGLDAATLRAERPELIVCDLSGYGSDGPYRDKKAYDLLVQAETGVLSVTGTADEQVKTGISVADIAGGMYAYSGVLTALLHRERSGDGAHVEVSLFDALTEWMGHPIYYTLLTDDPPARTGASHANVYPYGPFECADGTVQLGIQNEREWERFCRSVLGDESLLDDERFVSNAARSANRESLLDIIEAAFAARPVADVLAALDAAAIANSERRDVRGLIEHPQHAERDRWAEVEVRGRMVPALRPPVGIEGAVDRFDPVPAVGQHTESILAELGF